MEHGDGIADRPDRFRILFVCTGNMCRSPAGELLARHLLVGRLGGRQAARFEVSSAGVQAPVGAPMHPEARAQLQPWGLHGAHSERFVARQLDEGMVKGADLVLGATPRHRSTILEEFPRALRITFSVREFARLAAAVPTIHLPVDPVERAGALVERVRRQPNTSMAADDDIPDPIDGPTEGYRQATALIFESLRTIMDAIAPRPDVPDRPKVQHRSG